VSDGRSEGASIVRDESDLDRAMRALLRSARTIAVVGASPNPARPVHGVMAAMLRAGYHVIPVNPGQAGHEILGQVVYARLADIPEPVDVVNIFRRREALAGVVDEALALMPKPKAIWMQLGLVDEGAAAKARAAGLTVVMDRCIKVERARLM
jgi:predicted CoA-binding protein